MKESNLLQMLKNNPNMVGSSNKTKNVNFSVSGWFIPVLTMFLIGLKVTNYIAWSWWIIFLPAILMYGFGLVLMIIAFVFMLMTPNR